MMRALARAIAWKWHWRTPYPWLRDFFPLIALAAACISVGLAAGYRVSGATQADVHPGILGDPGHLAIMLYRQTGNAMLAVNLVVLVVAAGAYWLRQKIRLLYAVIELCLGTNVAGLAVASMASDLATHHLAPVVWNQDFFRLATGIYFVIRGMTNTRDGFELRPPRDRVEKAASAESVEPGASSVVIPAEEHLETPPQVT